MMSVPIIGMSEMIAIHGLDMTALRHPPDLPLCLIAGLWNCFILQDAPKPSMNRSASTAAVLRSPFCPANVPWQPQRTVRPLTRSPFRSPHPKIPSFCRAARSQPWPTYPHPRPTSSPRLRHFSPPIRPKPVTSTPLLKCTHIRTIISHGSGRVSNPPARGTDPAARNPYFRTGQGPSRPYRRSLVGASRQRRHGRSARLPRVLICHTAPHSWREIAR